MGTHKKTDAIKGKDKKFPLKKNSNATSGISMSEHKKSLAKYTPTISHMPFYKEFIKSHLQ